MAALGASVVFLTPCVSAASASAAADGRSAELVSRQTTTGRQALRMWPVVSPDSDSVVLAQTQADADSLGSKINVFSVARRSERGWQQVDATVAEQGESKPFQYALEAVAPDAGRVLVTGGGVLDAASTPPGEANAVRLYDVRPDVHAAALLSRGTAFGGQPASAPDVVFAGSSTAADVVYFSTNADLLEDAAGTNPGRLKLYRRDGTGLHLVSVLPNGQPVTGANVRTAAARAVPIGGDWRHAVSKDGRRIFFTAGPELTEVGGVNPLYLRDGDDRTVAVSASRRAGEVGVAQPATFIGASPDADSVYFSADLPLTDDAEGAAIYRYRLSDDSLTRLTGDPGTDGLGLATRFSSDDASTLYFVATAALASGATPGANNAYLWRGGTFRFVADLGSDGEVSRVSRDGRFAVVSTSASLGGAFTGGTRQLYRYDAEDGSMQCASCRSDGTANEGPSDITFRPEGYGQDTTAQRGIADDGHVFFTSRDRLTADDPSTGEDVYEYTGTEVRMLSNGEGSTFLTDNSNDGSSVFMTSTGAQTPEDTDGGDFDLFVRRAGGGFSQEPAVEQCQGDACQGPTRGAGPALVPHSDKPGSGNVAPQKPVASPSVLAPPSIGSSSRRGLARKGKGLITVRVSGGGSLTVRATRRSGGRRISAGTASRTVGGTQPAHAAVTLKLNAASRKALRVAGRLTIRVEARLSGSKPKSTTITLRRAAR